MALGGGQFTTQNKVLPGAYTMFVSAKRAQTDTFDRGVSAMGLELDWGPEGQVIEINADSVREDAPCLLGYAYEDDKLKGLRDLFLNSRKVYAYRLNSGGKKASSAHAQAKYGGIRGNDIKITITPDVDAASSFVVKTLMGNKVVDSQTVAAVTELAENQFVTWKTDTELAETAGETLSGGDNGTVSGDAHQAMLDKLESYSFNALGYVGSDGVTKKLYCNYCKRLRDEVGAKFQVVVHDEPFDYEGVINVKNSTKDALWPESSAVYWATGAIAGCGINAANTNKKYDGEFDIHADYMQSQLKQAIAAGEFTFHNVNGSIHVLTDINSLTTFTEEKNEDFRENKVIRIIDQIAMDIGGIFNAKFIGKNNTAAMRSDLWSRIVKHHNALQGLGALEEFSDKDVTVAQGVDKKSVVVTDDIRPSGVMEKLYLTCYIS